MRGVVFFASVVLVLIACHQGKEKTQLASGKVTRSSRATHHYTLYEDGKIKTDQCTKVYQYGPRTDTIVTTQLFKYNAKGRQVEKQWLEDTSRSITIYDRNDSLIAEYLINGRGDTTYVEESQYIAGKLVHGVYRRLSYQFSENGAIEPGKYDTLVDESYDHFYPNDTTEKMVIKNRSGKADAEYFYTSRHKKWVRTEEFRFIGTSRYLANTTHVFPGTSDDSYRLNADGDTVSYVKSDYRDGKMVARTHSSGSMLTADYYDSNHKRTSSIEVDYTRRTKTTSSFIYDKAGRLKEEIEITEALPGLN